jgi:dTDP-4-dehydrorhamnose reductase
MKKILLLGSSSLIAHYLIPSLKKQDGDVQFLGQSVSNNPEHEIENFHASSSELEIIDEKFKSLNPDLVINMTRGEDQDALNLHKLIIERCNNSGAHYNYFSSFNALDANIESEHYEDDAPLSQTEYGQFKALCENELTSNSNNFSIFRFGAIHGWAPNSISRTETFLEHMLSGESLPVDKGILQNRLAANHLADMMAAVLNKKGSGVFHFGTVDGSEEIDFLRDLAESFGHPRDQIVEGGENICNALMIPERTLNLIGKEYERTEADTIHTIRHMIRLSQYIL